MAQAASTALPPLAKISAPAVALRGLPVTAIPWLAGAGGWGVPGRHDGGEEAERLALAPDQDALVERDMARREAHRDARKHLPVAFEQAELPRRRDRLEVGGEVGGAGALVRVPGVVEVAGLH